MAHKIETSYRWLINYEDSSAKLVHTYGIRGFIFTFDDVDDKDNTIEAQEIANEQGAVQVLTINQVQTHQRTFPRIQYLQDLDPKCRF